MLTKTKNLIKITCKENFIEYTKNSFSDELDEVKRTREVEYEVNPNLIYFRDDKPFFNELEIIETKNLPIKIDKGNVDYVMVYLSELLITVPPVEMVLEYFNNNTESENDDLQFFINSHLKEHLFWMTGIGIIDSIEILIKESISNGNIK